MRTQLETALGNCKFQHLCTCNNKSSFEDINEAIFYVYDEEGGESEKPVRIVNNGEDFQLTVHNKSLKKIQFVKTDKCLVVEMRNLKKCDCLIFDSENFYFVEIKKSKNRTRNAKRKEAVLQLISTIDLFIENNIDLRKFKTTALICFKTRFPRIIQASQNSSRAFFKERYNISLDEGNEIVF